MKIIGHRGARGLAPENTIAAVLKAMEYDVDEIEVDLRITLDGIVVLHHDDHLTDGDGQKHIIRRHKFEELRKHKPDLATLPELFEAAGSTPLYLEVKAREPVEPIAKLVEGSGSKVSLASKHQPTLLALHALLPEVQKIVIHPWSGVIATRRARQVGGKRISFNKICLWGGFISGMSRRGWQISAYSLNDPVKARKWAKHGLYGVVTDFPDLFC